MANFQNATRWLREGKKVTRPKWEEDSYWIIGEDGILLWKDGTPAKIHLNQLSADDWEIYGEKRDGEKEYEICKEACINEGCYFPPDYEFHRVIANIPHFVRAYFYLKGKRDKMKFKTKYPQEENK